jgi:undecaprenyl diphosphate synthase
MRTELRPAVSPAGRVRGYICRRRVALPRRHPPPLQAPAVAMGPSGMGKGLQDNGLPGHVAIIMDGNGRWARRRMLPRYMGHAEGVKAVRRVIEACLDKGIRVLTLFAFSSENWRRPHEEVGLLLELFDRTLQKELDSLDRSGIKVMFIGDRSAFAEKLRRLMALAETRTASNTRLTLVIAVNYGGRWDIAQAARTLARRAAAGELQPEAITPQLISGELSLAGLPEPDLFIRTGGERRVSNFLLWQLAYTELYFTDTLWPEFDLRALDAALDSYGRRERRFGRTSEQVEQLKGA